MVNSIITSMSSIYKKALAKSQDWNRVLKNFAKVANMNKNPTLFSHALKNIMKTRVYIEI